MNLRLSKYILFAVILILGSFFYPQSNAIRFKQITTEDGLSNNIINCMVQDQSGFLWFGTNAGLNRYDGYNFKSFLNNPEDSQSISSNIIWSLYEDRKSFIWAGTKNGDLCRYDVSTESFKNWKIESSENNENGITSIFEDQSGFIWIGTYRNGLYRLNISTNKFEHWHAQRDNPNSLSNNFVTAIVQDSEGSLWISTYNGLDRFNPNLNSDFFEHYYFYPDEVNIPGKNLIWNLNKSTFEKNTIWVCSLQGLFKFNTISKNFIPIKLPDSNALQFGNSVSMVSEVTFGDKKYLWVGTYGGLIHIDLDTESSERLTADGTSKSELLSNEIHKTMVDNSGVLWIGTNKGLNYLTLKSERFNSTGIEQKGLRLLSELNKKDIFAITQTADGYVWFGSSKGLFGLNMLENESDLFTIPGIEKLNIWSLYPGESDNLWIGTYGHGLIELDLRSRKLKTKKISNPDYATTAFEYIKAIHQDRNGLLWAGFWGGGLAKLDLKTNRIAFYRNIPDDPSSLSFDDVWVIHEDQKGRIWIGTDGGGLNLYDPQKNTFYRWTTDRPASVRLSSNIIHCIFESTKHKSLDNKDETILWIGTSAGLNKLVIKNDTSSSELSELNLDLKIISINNGVKDNSIESIIEDEKGNLWIGKNSGISVFNPTSNTFTEYSANDGLIGNSFNAAAALKIENGIMFFGSTAGVVFFNPMEISSSDYSPPVLITDFQIFNQSVIIGKDSPLKISITKTKQISLSYTQSVFSFQFAALDYNSPESIQYAYKMEGFDKEWIYCGSRRFVTYTNLDRGEYVFRVKATNSDGIWNEKGTQIAITINPPFWATWWAYSIYILMFISLLLFLRSVEIKRRIKNEEERLRREREAALLREAKLRAITIEQEKELEKQKIRNRIAQDLHDEIGSNLSSISLMSELIQKDGKINSDVFAKINRIYKVAKGSTQAMRDIVWLTNPSSDSLKDLISKMNEVARDMLGAMKWEFDFSKKISEINLLPETKRNVFFIYKEALNNILKHSDAGNVDIKLNVIDTILCLDIKDDGKGFNTNTGFSGNGLKNLQSRAKEINGKLKINSSPGNGTSLELEVNITQVRD